MFKEEAFQSSEIEINEGSNNYSQEMYEYFDKLKMLNINPCLTSLDPDKAPFLQQTLQLEEEETFEEEHMVQQPPPPEKAIQKILSSNSKEQQYEPKDSSRLQETTISCSNSTMNSS